MGGPGSGRKPGAVSNHMKSMLHRVRRGRVTNISKLKTTSKSSKMKYFKMGKRAGAG